MKRLLVALCAAMMVLVAYTPLKAITIEAASLDELSAESTIIVEGSVGQSRSFWDDEHRKIYTLTGFDVSNVFKGKNVGKGITIQQLGGTVGSTTMEIDGVQQLQRNQRLILFLQKVPGTDQYIIHSFTLGKFYVVQDANGAIKVENALGSAIVIPNQAQKSARTSLNARPYSQFISDLQSILSKQSAGGQE